MATLLGIKQLTESLQLRVREVGNLRALTLRHPQDAALLAQTAESVSQLKTTGQALANMLAEDLE